MNELTQSGVGKHGKWIALGFGGYAKSFACSVCEAILDTDKWQRPEELGVKECPVCGAKMDGKEGKE